MEQPQPIWHTQTAIQDVAGPLQKKLSVMSQSQLECVICYNSYDNVFKTPKQLGCTHTFCLECLSRLMVVSQTDQNGDDGSKNLTCPFCRQLTTLSEEGPPGLTTDQEVLCKLPSHQQQEEPVWIEGQKLCYKTPRQPGMGTPDSPTAFCVCIDIGATKPVIAPVPTRSRFGLLDRLADWKRLVLFIVLMVLLVVVVSWPLQCVFNTGKLRCTKDDISPTNASTPRTLSN
ncbi:RING finger protein 223 [Thunnus maccoyii]|uniref:RING finger protein 223 n=1 Tax=Thunnus maccoyii TaxID=8240 RepID=UPI001C4A98FE|nr:RING finger protein 223 [Thunnus maccoyii]